MADRDLIDLTSHCIRCGLCLETCPTFSETGEETASPRGRIYLVRSAAEGKLVWEDIEAPISQCLGCRACETACPSGVEYGAILELSRDRLGKGKRSLARKLLLQTITHPALLRLQMRLSEPFGGKTPGLVSQLLAGAKPEADMPQEGPKPNFPPLTESALPPVRGEVYLLEGCAMRVLYPRVHEATRRLLRRVCFAVKDVPQGCCGALHAHNGDLGQAKKLATKLAAQMPHLPIIVNSAGCGSAMKEYEALIGHQEIGARVFDAAEFLFAQGLQEALAKSPGLAQSVTYHDACHLAHGQKIRSQPRELIRAVPGVHFVELMEADACCGSAGIYNVVQPVMARQLLERKWKRVEATGAELVVTGNPGCHSWIAQASREHKGPVRVLHTLEFLEFAFDGAIPQE